MDGRAGGLSDHEIPTADDRPWSIAARERSERYAQTGGPRWCSIVIEGDVLDWDRARWAALMATGAYPEED